jgi:hypothetical protein
MAAGKSSGSTASTSVRPTAVPAAQGRVGASRANDPTISTTATAPGSVFRDPLHTTAAVDQLNQWDKQDEFQRDMKKMDKTIEADQNSQQARISASEAAQRSDQNFQREMAQQAWSQQNQGNKAGADLSRERVGGGSSRHIPEGYMLAESTEDAGLLGNPGVKKMRVVAHKTAQERVAELDNESREKIAYMQTRAQNSPNFSANIGMGMENAFRQQQLAIERDDAYSRRLAAFLPATRG